MFCGSAKTKTFVTTVTAGSIYDVLITYNASSIDFRFAASGAAFGTATNIAGGVAGAASIESASKVVV